jgi:hypothetical protein
MEIKQLEKVSLGETGLDLDDVSDLDKSAHNISPSK